MRRLQYSIVVLMFALGAVRAGTVADVTADAPLEIGTVVLSPKDTYLNINKKNYSTSTTLPAYTWPDNKVANAILMKFDLSTIPAGAMVTSATLQLSLVGNDNAVEPWYAVGAHKVIRKNPNVLKATGYSADGAAAWTANTCCQGVPLAQADISPAYDLKPIDKIRGPKTWSITTMVQEWLANPATNMGLILNADVSKPRDRYRTFASMENGTASLRPFLKVTFAAADVTPPTVAISAPLPGAVSGTVPLNAVALDNVAVGSVQFRVNGTAVGPELAAFPYAFNWDSTSQSDGTYAITAVAKDTTGNTATSMPVVAIVNNGILLFSPEDTTLNINANNYSTDPLLMTYTWPDFRPANAVLMKFNLASVPAGAVVQDATLFLALVQSDAAPEAEYTVSASKVVGRNPVIAQATGYHADAATAWSPSACCHDAVPLAQSDISPPYSTLAVDKAPGFKALSMTAMVQEWVADPSSNFGVLVNSDTSKAGDHYRWFASMEHADATLRPVLRLTYSNSGDTAPPVVAGVGASGVTSSAATINWTTDEPADSQVEYGPTSSYGSASPLTAALTGGHSVTLSDLNDSTEYHFRVRSRDQSGNATTSEDHVFTTLDGTAPTVAMSAPANGATVSGTINLAATASDNAGVAGVQFALDGASLGAEDTASPYSASWNTTTTADGNHTLTATARDAAGNITISIAITVAVANAPPPSGGLAALYPGDVGIENDPNVVFVERFDQSSLSNLFGRWTDVKNGSSMSFSTDAPAGSPVGTSLTIPWSSSSDGGHLYRRLSQAVDDTLYVRYYVRYPSNNSYNHTGIWMGGYNPPLDWPNPQAGVKPTGSDRFSAAAEQNSLTNRFDHYDYWMGMRQSGDGAYWGNLLLNDPDVQATSDQWMCVEQMVKLNNPVTALNGEQAVWLNGVKVSHLGQGFPNGTWSGGIFTQDPAGTPFPGFQWRNTSSLNLNWIWLQVYATSGAGSLKYAHVVAAKSYIGCLASGSADPAMPPTVSMTAPAPGVTISGTMAVSANASDSVGVAGVQFKLDGVNLGAEDTTAPYSVSWNTGSIANGAHTLSAVARNTAGLTAAASPVTVTVDNAVSSAWPNEPAGMVPFNNQPWDNVIGNGWNYLRRSATQDSTIVTNNAAPFSPSKELQVTYTAGCCQDAEPGVHWLGVPYVREIFTGWFVKLSPNWIPNPAGGGKITFLFTDVGGQVYTNFYHPSDAVQGAPYRIGVNTEWAPYGQKIWLPNVTTTLINPGEYHRVEVYYRWETTPGVSGDGIIRWWVDGILNGDHRNVHYPAARFIEFQIAPTVQYAGPENRQMYFDHAYVSIRQ